MPVSLPLTQLIHENLAIIMTFAFSRAGLSDLRENRFVGDWKYLDKSLFEIANQRAQRAVLEIATLLRLLDDREGVSDYLRQTGGSPLGHVKKEGLPDEPLYFRDLTNKIIHASRLDWDYSVADQPKIVCLSTNQQRWVSAEIDVVRLAAFCGKLVS